MAAIEVAAMILNDEEQDELRTMIRSQITTLQGVVANSTSDRIRRRVTRRLIILHELAGRMGVDVYA
jgi:hypothetical protein